MPFIEREIVLKNGPPWGFRLFEDENQGLIVHRIRQCSPAQEGKLREGDIILAINRYSTRGIRHIEALDMIDFIFDTLILTVGRHESVANKKVSFNSQRGAVQENVVTKLEMNLQREKMTTPASPDMVPVPISKLMKEYDIPPRPDNASKKRRFANSEFFSDPNTYYPTVEEKMEMAKELAESLTAPINKSSKGAFIFEKQRLRVDKYVKEGPDPEPERNLLQVILPGGRIKNIDPPEIHPPPPPTNPPVCFPGLPLNFEPHPPPLPPGAPKTMKEYLERIKTYPTVKHDTIGPEKCFTIAAALHKGRDRGAQIFCRIRNKSEKWIVTSENVMQPKNIILSPKMVHKPKLTSKLANTKNIGINHDTKLHEQNLGQKCGLQKTSQANDHWRPIKFSIPPRA